MTMEQRIRELEAERAPHPAPVRYAWWDRSGPRPEARPGERLFVVCWDDEPDPPAAQGTGADVPGNGARGGYAAEPSSLMPPAEA